MGKLLIKEGFVQTKNIILLDEVQKNTKKFIDNLKNIRPEIDRKLLNLSLEIKSNLISIDALIKNIDYIYINYYLVRQDILEYLIKRGIDIQKDPLVDKYFKKKWLTSEDGKKIREVEYWQIVNDEKNVVFE